MKRYLQSGYSVYEAVGLVWYRKGGYRPIETELVQARLCAST